MNCLIVISLVSVFCSGLVNSYEGTSCTGTGYIVDPNDCNVFYSCANGVYVIHHCPSGLNWNQRGAYCDWPENAPCEENVQQPEPPTTTTPKAPQPITTTTKAPPTRTTTTTTKAPQTTTTTTKTPTTTTTAPGGNALVSHAEFQSAASTKGGYPDISYYQGFIKSLPQAGITTRREAILFLAHATWETVGFIYTKEVYCQTHLSDCLRAYPNNAGGLSGKVYYGRGMMQLTWDYNYKAASAYLYGDDRLLQNPDSVGEIPEVGWATAAYYWFANVHIRSQTFGSTLKAINGALECDGGTHGQNRYLRFMHYKDILSKLGETQPEDADGWCTAW